MPIRRMPTDLMVDHMVGHLRSFTKAMGKLNIRSMNIPKINIPDMILNGRWQTPLSKRASSCQASTLIKGILSPLQRISLDVEPNIISSINSTQWKLKDRPTFREVALDRMLIKENLLMITLMVLTPLTMATSLALPRLMGALLPIFKDHSRMLRATKKIMIQQDTPTAATQSLIKKRFIEYFMDRNFDVLFMNHSHFLSLTHTHSQILKLNFCISLIFHSYS